MEAIREIAAMKNDDVQKTYAHVDLEKLQDMQKNGWQIVFVDTDEPVPEDELIGLLTPKLLTFIDVVQIQKEVATNG